MDLILVDLILVDLIRQQDDDADSKSKAALLVQRHARDMLGAWNIHARQLTKFS